MIKAGWIAAACLLSLAAGAAPYEIGTALDDAAFWTSDPVLFAKRHQEQGFKFASEDRTMSDSRREGGVTCFGIPVYETRVSFGAEGGIDRVELMLFNRGGGEDGEGRAHAACHRLQRQEGRDTLHGLLGKGHELKRMPAGWAWTISRCA